MELIGWEVRVVVYYGQPEKSSPPPALLLGNYKQSNDLTRGFIIQSVQLSMMVKKANDGIHQANDGEIVV